MNKVVQILEKYVQWIALGLGAAFMLFMVYSYVINNPIKTEVAGKKVDLGNVDLVTRDGPARTLDADMKRPGGITIPVPQVTDAVVRPLIDPPVVVMADAGQKFLAPTTPIVIPDPTKIVDNKTPNKGVLPGNVAPVPPGGAAPPQVGNLPEPPAPIFIASSVGRSSVAPLPPAPNQPPLPLGLNGQPADVDKTWVSFHYKVPAAALADAFKAIPPARRFTSFLRAELVREEKDSGGNWVKETAVAPVMIAFQDAPGWPGDPASKSPAQPAGPLFQDPNANNPQNPSDPTHLYIEWAQKHVQSVLQPVFYQVNKGDLIGLPGDPLQHVGVIIPQKIFDPAHPGLPSTWTPEQKAAVEAYRKQKQEELKNRRPTTPTKGPAPGRGGGAGGEVAFAPRDNDRPILLAQLPGGGFGRGGGPEDMGDGVTGGIGTSYTQQNNEALQKLATSLPKDATIDLNPTPTGFVAQLQQLGLDGVDVIAYDETGEPGKTYRYRLRYYVLNPLFGSEALVANPADAKRLALASAPSEWTGGIDVPPAVSFFLASAPLGSDTIKLDLFRWQSGTVNKWTQSVSPGDRIGMKVTQTVPLLDAQGRPVPAQPGAAGAVAVPAPVSGGGAANPAMATVKLDVDYTTQWTVVDVRNGNGDKYVILRDESGNTVKREFRVDQAAPSYKELREQVPSLTAAPVAEAGNALR